MRLHRPPHHFAEVADVFRHLVVDESDLCIAETGDTPAQLGKIPDDQEREQQGEEKGRADPEDSGAERPHGVDGSGQIEPLVLLESETEELDEKVIMFTVPLILTSMVSIGLNSEISIFLIAAV